MQDQLNTYNGYNGRISTLETSVAVIEQEMLPSRVSGLETRMGTAEADILNLQGFVQSTQNNQSGASNTIINHYPLEIVVVINGSAYAIPARSL
jgi:hypothetical protein